MHAPPHTHAHSHTQVLTRKTCPCRAVAERAAAEAALAGSGSAYLRDAAVTTTRGGFSVWGAPWQPRFWGAFNVRRGPDIAAIWARIPATADVVVTHGPVAGHGDFVPRSREHVGCEDLLREVRALCRAAPRSCCTCVLCGLLLFRVCSDAWPARVLLCIRHRVTDARSCLGA